ncbi:hypothetical protein [Leadbetterella sp. DM7]|uniref:hypothetical protein n=1 Tax=Leadbetterella sp. DM7 TaxID=3235085 RepID=UPI00349EF6E0
MGGVKDFYDVYIEMREANLIDPDRYFHSKANYKASHLFYAFINGYRNRCNTENSSIIIIGN